MLLFSVWVEDDVQFHLFNVLSLFELPNLLFLEPGHGNHDSQVKLSLDLFLKGIPHLRVFLEYPVPDLLSDEEALAVSLCLVQEARLLVEQALVVSKLQEPNVAYGHVRIVVRLHYAEANLELALGEEDYLQPVVVLRLENGFLLFEVVLQAQHYVQHEFLVWFVVVVVEAKGQLLPLALAHVYYSEQVIGGVNKLGEQIVPKDLDFDVLRQLVVND